MKFDAEAFARATKVYLTVLSEKPQRLYQQFATFQENTLISIFYGGAVSLTRTRLHMAVFCG